MKAVTFGELMIRLATPGHLRFAQASHLEVSFSGAEANVAASLAGYGVRAFFVTRLPYNDLADAALAGLHKYGIDTSYVHRGGDRMGAYYLETGAAQRPSKVVYDRAHSAFAEIKPGMIDWEKVFQNASWFHWTGITPAVSKEAALVCKEACEAAVRANVTVSCDLNYRQNLWKWGRTAGQVMSELVPYCDLVVANEEDCQKVFGIRTQMSFHSHEIDTAAYEKIAQEITRLFEKVTRVAFPLRGSINASHNLWTGAMWNGSELLTTKQYDITDIVDRVGTGDSFAAGLIYGLSTFPNDEQKALNFATAASCLKHSIRGDFLLASVEEVMKLMQGDGSGRVIR